MGCLKNSNRCPNEHTSACTKYQPTPDELKKQEELINEKLREVSKVQ